MKIRLLLVTLFMCCSVNLFSMDDVSKKDQDLSVKNWDWYITHLRLSAATSKLACTVTEFDPAVRIYDGDTDELVLNLQRITDEGKNTDFPARDVSVRAYNKPGDTSLVLLEVKDKERKILSVGVGEPKKVVVSYDARGEADLKIAVGEDCGHVLMSRALVRLSPSCVFAPGLAAQYEDFFKAIREAKQKQVN